MLTLHSVLRRIVRNDAIRVDPPEVYNWRVLALAASVRHLFLNRMTICELLF
jgi:hypothetical protein